MKVPLHLVPPSFIAYTSVGMLDGERKYGRNNYLETPMEASTLVGAALRHIGLWFDGQEKSSDRGVPHLANAAASLAILVERQTKGTLIDDRNPGDGSPLGALMSELSKIVVGLIALQGDKPPANRPFTRLTSRGDGSE